MEIEDVTELAADQEPAPTAFPMTVEDFCRELSAADRRPELIYAFSRDEKKGGRISDTAANYQSRFEAFATKPA